MDPISINFMIEKRVDHGEDSNPLSIVKDNFYAVGVFDGMGGSGATKCESEYGLQTQAYVASRLTCKAISEYIDKVSDTSKINSEDIKKSIQQRIEYQKEQHKTVKQIGLKSRLIREYPTTLAVTTAHKNECGTYSVNSYWAGDSRNYLWTPDGFYQISKDDLDIDKDPFENLVNDEALSNCVCSDRDFCINNRVINDIASKFIILSATDGCFNYFPTPMHFQEVLLSGLKRADSREDWEEYCKKEFSSVAGDDVSISLQAIGFESFEELKSTFNSTLTGCIEKINNARDEIEKKSLELEKAKKSYEELKKLEWDEYKVSYMKFFNDEMKSNDEEERENKSDFNSPQDIEETSKDSKFNSDEKKDVDDANNSTNLEKEDSSKEHEKNDKQEIKNSDDEERSKEDLRDNDIAEDEKKDVDAANSSTNSENDNLSKEYKKNDKDKQESNNTDDEERSKNESQVSCLEKNNESKLSEDEKMIYLEIREIYSSVGLDNLYRFINLTQYFLKKIENGK